MKKNIFFALFSAMLLLTACQQHEIDRPANIGDGFTLVGHTSAQTKTAFGAPDGNTIPFLWSEGDVICVGGNYSEPLIDAQAGQNTAEFTFLSGTLTAGDDVYYGGLQATEAVIPSLQSGFFDELGVNCELGYSTINEEGTFTLEHLSSYIWLNTYTSVADLVVSKVIISAANDIVGKSVFNKEDKTFSNYSTDEDEVALSSTKVIELFQEYDSNIENYKSSQFPVYLEESSDEEIWAVAVTYPVTTGALNITYVFVDEEGNETCQASYTYPSKTLVAGETYRITQEIKADDLYTLKTLTFEDDALSTYWANLIPGEDEQSYAASSSLIYNNAYTWSDATTKISHTFPVSMYDTQDFSCGGYVISTHCGTMDQLADATDIYQYQLSIPLATAHNGSENFCIGYHASDINLDDAYKPALAFSDDVARVIDHMYITNASVTMYCIINGSGFSDAFDGDDYLDVVATGYNGETKVGTIKFRLADGNSTLVSDWEKWDLSSLGAVTKVVFHMEEYQIGYGSWYCTPMYFAFDDVAVRFPIE